MQVYTPDGTKLILDKEVGQGGEARIMSIKGQSRVVAKLYHTPTPRHEAKLQAMVANPPFQPSSHVAIAWPLELLYYKPDPLKDPAGLLKGLPQPQFMGFVMPHVQNSDPIFNFYNPVKRRELYPDVTWQALHRIALNLMIVAKAIHDKGYLIGDVNESNILVNSQTLVTLVDTDSFQVTDLVGQVHRCAVGKPEYTAPELHGVDFKTVDHHIEHDLFGLGVLIFQLLMEGYHPFAGVLTSRISVGRVDVYSIKKGYFPYRDNKFVKPPPSAAPFHILHPGLQEAFMRCFVEGHRVPRLRPTAQEWRDILWQAEKSLKACYRNPQHFYSSHLSDCPWCQVQENIHLKAQQEQAYSAYSIDNTATDHFSWQGCVVFLVIFSLLYSLIVSGPRNLSQNYSYATPKPVNYYATATAKATLFSGKYATIESAWQTTVAKTAIATTTQKSSTPTPTMQLPPTMQTGVASFVQTFEAELNQIMATSTPNATLILEYYQR